MPTVSRETPGLGQIPEGQIIGGRYRIVGVIGRGGFGTVYEAAHVTTGHSVAVKVLGQRGGAEGEEAARRFFQEAATTSRLSHPNTVRVFDFGQTDGGHLFLTMERLVGDSLQDLLTRLASEQQTISEAQTIEIGVAVLRSLGEAHAHGLVHRDLKPANIFLHRVAGGDSIVKVLDFGIVKDTDSSMTQAGKALGTPTHMSPEQAMGKPIDARSDLYALGVVLYECLTGTLPFTGDNPLAVVMQHVTEPCEPLLSRAPDVARPAVASVIEQALAKNPNRRFADAAAMRVALQDAFGQQPSGAFPIVSGRRSRRMTAPAIGAMPPSGPGVTAAADRSGKADRAPTAFESQETVVSDVFIAPDVAGSRLRQRPSAPPNEASEPSRLVKLNLPTAPKPVSDTAAIAAPPPRPVSDTAAIAPLPAVTPAAPRPSTLRRVERTVSSVAPPPPPVRQVAGPGSREFAERPTVHIDAVAEPPSEPAAAANVAAGKLSDAELEALQDESTAVGVPIMPPASPPAPEPEPLQVIGMADVTHATIPEPPGVTSTPEPSAGHQAEVAAEPVAAAAEPVAAAMDPVAGGAEAGADSDGRDTDSRPHPHVPDDDAHDADPPAASAPAASAPAASAPAADGQVEEEDLERVPVPARRPVTRTRPPPLRASPPPSPLAGISRNPFAALSERLPGGQGLGAGPGASPMAAALSRGLQSLTRELERRSLRRVTNAADTVSAMWIGDDANTLVFGDNAGDIRLVYFEQITEQPVTVLDAQETVEVGHHSALVTAVAADTGHGLIASACVDGWLRLWDPADGSQIAEHRLASRALSLAISLDGRLLIAGCEDGGAHLLRLPGLEVRRVMQGHASAINAVAATSSRRLLATAGEDGTVRTWDPVGGGGRLTSRAHEGAVAAVALTRSAKWVISGGWDGRLVVWSARDGAERHNIAAHTDIVAGVAISPDEAFLATASDDRSVRIWDMQTGDLVAERGDFRTGAKHLRFSSDSRCVYIGAWDGTCRRLSAVGPL